MADCSFFGNGTAYSTCTNGIGGIILDCILVVVGLLCAYYIYWVIKNNKEEPPKKDG